MDPIAEARRQWTSHGWEDAAPGMALVTSLARVNQLIGERIDDVLRPLDLTFARYEVLRLLAFSRRGRMPMARLGALLQVHPTSVTSAVARLERQGYVERQRHTEDGRVVLATLTPAGRSIVEEATVGLNEHVFRSAFLDGGQLEQLLELLTAVRRGAGDVAD